MIYDPAYTYNLTDNRDQWKNKKHGWGSNFVIKVVQTKSTWKGQTNDCSHVYKRIDLVWTTFRSIYSSSERSEQFLVTECFFNLILEVSQFSCMWKVVKLSPIVFLDMQQSKSRFLTTTAFLTHISKGQLISKCLFGVNVST